MEEVKMHLGDARPSLIRHVDAAVAAISGLDGEPDADGTPTAALPVGDLNDQAIVVAPVGKDVVSAAAKRSFDIVMASVILVVAAPVMAVVAVCVVLESRGPVFYRARRVGRWGEPLDVLKFRKMRAGARGGPLTVVDDERFTRIGRLLARTKLDELPQLFSVIRGHMSLIGPRPEDPHFVHRFAEAFEQILCVRPGITGLSQLAFRAESRILDAKDPVEDYQSRILPQKIELDHLYIAFWNPLLDARILLWTIATALLGIPIAVNRSTGRMTVRFGRGGRRQAAETSDHTKVPGNVTAGPLQHDPAGSTHPTDAEE